MISATDVYRQVARIRALEDRALELSADGVFEGSVHVCNGHELIPAVFGALRRPEDKVLATYRGHGWALACGIPLTEVLAEICQKAGGINGGRSGSLMITAPEYGFIGENSIVGAGVPIADGVGLAARLRKTGGVAISTVGDGAMSQGALHEGLVFAAAKNLPVIFICENNGWAEMTPTSEVTRHPQLARRAEAYGIPARSVDGSDFEASVEAAEWAFAEVREGRGPVFLEFTVARLKGHYNRDIQHYRSKDDIEQAELRDPLPRLRSDLVRKGSVSVDDLASIDEEVAGEVEAATALVRDMPAPELMGAQDHLYAADSPTSWRAPSPVTQSKTMEYWRAVNTALSSELDQRSDVVIFGEDVAGAGGIFGVTRGLQKRYGTDRVFDTPIAESAILGTAVGAAIEGLRPVVEIMWMDFLMVALDQLVNQAANVRYVSQGRQTAPLTVRMQQGATPGSCAQHTQSLEALIAHIPGLRLGLPATPADAYAMTRAAIADPDPVVLIESRELYQLKGEVAIDAEVEPIGGARLHGRSSQVVVITWGAMVQRALSAQAQLAEDGIEVSVLDVRWLSPLDLPSILDAVRAAGGRAVVAHEANQTGGFGAEVVTRIHEELGKELSLDIRRVAAPDTRIPTPGILQSAVIPGADTIVAACISLTNDAIARV
ncbi:thiamine pyrophosphate-dependent enzyme [Cnuibacter sp. UC19_7]|uniref:alpha-ketoacid dehydrogenase subunit alpha/beta n=1 Tax=Cnuibacter sp. UC19_7 TaxID=3350166 RepID=UPI0036700707